MSEPWAAFCTQYGLVVRPCDCEQLGNATRKQIGNKHWQKRVFAAIDNLRALTHFDRLYIGGGNSRRLEGPLPAAVTIVDNQAGIAGGAALWRD